MIYVILGTTASGKTDLAIRLAKEFSMPLISCDAYQVYKEFELGTACPRDEELEGIDHHFFKDYSIDDANAIEEITREAKQYGVNFTNDIYQEMYRNNGSFNSATYEAKLTNKANSYTGKYKDKYKVALWQGYREAVRLAKELYDSEKQFREEAEKEIIKEEEEIVTTDRYVPKDTTVENNNNTNNNTSNNTNNNTNNDNNNTNNENSTTVKTETVRPSADNNYTYEEETIVDRVYSK